jgi:hypothetical protein
VKFLFVNGRVAIIVRYWEQRAQTVEGGARVELRRVEEAVGRNPVPGSAGLTVGPISDGGLWRADLFVLLTEAGTSCFHYHPKFEFDDVGERFFDKGLEADPRAWVAERLSDLPGLLEGCGAGDLVTSLDLDEHRRALPLMLSAVDACLARLPAAMTR